MFEKIGQQLRQAREDRSLTLEQASHSTRMRLHYLQALEAGDFRALPSLVQARGFLRTYAGYLGLEADSLLAELDEDGKPAQAALPEPVEAAARSDDPSPQPGQASAAEVQAIFTELGQRLQRQRELLGLSLEDVAKHTHLRTHNLQALECGDLDELPSPVQGRGMLKNYATFLGLDPEPLLLRFAEGLQARLALKQAARGPARPVGASRVTKRASLPRRIFTGDLLIGVVLVIFLVAFVIWGSIRVFALRAEQGTSPTAPSVAEVLLYTPTASLTPSPSPSPQAAGEALPAGAEATSEATGEAAGGTEEVTPPQEVAGPVQVYVTVRQRAWMRVTVDGEVEFEGRVIPGSAYQFAGEEQIEILTGNGAALQIFFNQQDLGPLGLFGQVVHQVYTPLGIQTPTPTITPTGTPTPRPSPTAPGTATLQPFITGEP